MTGFSGGRKSICPGIVSIKTIRAYHSPKFLESPSIHSIEEGMEKAITEYGKNARIAVISNGPYVLAGLKEFYKK
jgi:nickel-dependent lactate racemase